MGYDKNQAQHEFTRWSESYDQCVLQWLLFGPSHRAIIARIKNQWGDQPVRVLDIGCGTGIFAERIRAALPNAQVVGIDLVFGMLAQGLDRWKRHEASVCAIQADSERLPFDRGTFDVVTCANSFHHYPNQKHAVTEMRRVLRPSGRLMLVDGYRDRPWGWFIYEVCVARVEGAVHHATAAELRRMSAAAGLQAVSQTIHRGPAPFLLTEATAPEPSQVFAPSRATVAGVGR